MTTPSDDRVVRLLLPIHAHAARGDCTPAVYQLAAGIVAGLVRDLDRMREERDRLRLTATLHECCTPWSAPDGKGGFTLSHDPGCKTLERHAALSELERWQREVADGLGYLNRPEGQDGYEVAEPAVIVAAMKEAEHDRDFFDAERQREIREAESREAELREALRAAQAVIQIAAVPYTDEGNRRLVALNAAVAALASPSPAPEPSAREGRVDVFLAHAEAWRRDFMDDAIRGGREAAAKEPESAGTGPILGRCVDIDGQSWHSPAEPACPHCGHTPCAPSPLPAGDAPRDPQSCACGRVDVASGWEWPLDGRGGYAHHPDGCSAAPSSAPAKEDR